MDEIQRIILDVQGEEKLRQLNKELEVEHDALLKLSTQLRNGQISQGFFDAAARTSAKEVARLGSEIKDLEKSSGMLRSGGLLQLSYVMDDLANTTGGWERKLAAISNNIPGLVASLGGSAGIAGAIGIIGTAAIACAPLVKKLVESFTGPEGIPGVQVVLDDAAKKVKELQSQLDRILNARPYREKQTAEDVSFYMGDVGGAQVVRGLAAAMGQAGEGAPMTDAEKKRLKDLEETAEFTRNNWTIPGTREAAERDLQNAQMEIRRRLDAENEKLAGELVARAPTDAGARRRMRGLAGRFPGGLPKGFASDLADLEPEVAEAQDEADRKEREATEEYRRRKRERRKAVDEEIRDNEARDAENLRDFKTNRARNRAGVDLDLQLTEEADRDNLREWNAARRRKAQAQARERRATDDELRQTEREDAANLRTFRASEKKAPVRRAAAQVRDVARANGFELSPEQLTEAGRAAVSMASDGLDAQQAAFTAFMEQVEAMRRVQARAQAMQQQWQGAMGYQSQMATGADWGGQFSAMPPMMGGGFGFSG